MNTTCHSRRYLISTRSAELTPQLLRRTPRFVFHILELCFFKIMYRIHSDFQIFSSPRTHLNKHVLQFKERTNKRNEIAGETLESLLVSQIQKVISSGVRIGARSFRQPRSLQCVHARHSSAGLSADLRGRDRVVAKGHVPLLPHILYAHSWGTVFVTRKLENRADLSSNLSRRVRSGHSRRQTSRCSFARSRSAKLAASPTWRWRVARVESHWGE